MGRGPGRHCTLMRVQSQAGHVTRGASKGRGQEGFAVRRIGVLTKASDKTLASAHWASWPVQQPTRRADHLSIPK